MSEAYKILTHACILENSNTRQTHTPHIHTHITIINTDSNTNNN